MRAPSATCSAWSGVWRSGAAESAGNSPGVTGAPPSRRRARRHQRCPLCRFSLRDSPPASRRLTPSVSGRPPRPTAAFQSALSPAVLLPESFRGGCSFGAARPSFYWGRGLSCGRAYGSDLCSTTTSTAPSRSAPGGSAAGEVLVEIDHVRAALKPDHDVEVGKGASAGVEHDLDMVVDPAPLLGRRKGDVHGKGFFAEDRLIRARQRDKVAQIDIIAASRGAALGDDDVVERSTQRIAGQRAVCRYVAEET